LIPVIKTLKPCVIEVHCPWIRDQFKKNGFHTINEPAPDSLVCLMANYELNKGSANI